jgi:hypothetical protein
MAQLRNTAIGALALMALRTVRINPASIGLQSCWAGGPKWKI